MVQKMFLYIPTSCLGFVILFEVIHVCENTTVSLREVDGVSIQHLVLGLSRSSISRWSAKSEDRPKTQIKSDTMIQADAVKLDNLGI